MELYLKFSIRLNGLHREDFAELLPLGGHRIFALIYFLQSVIVMCQTHEVVS